MARQHFVIEISSNPFHSFTNHPDFGSRAYILLGCTILHGRRIHLESICLLGFADEIERMLSTPPYQRVFNIDEPCYEELITEFYASFEFHGNDVMFQLGGVMHRLTMQEFGIALGLWTVEEQTTNVYATAIRDFTEDVSIYWMHISRDNTPFIQFKTKGTGLLPVLRYLRAIIAYTITGRTDS